jgi:hypothetical protein
MTDPEQGDYIYIEQVSPVRAFIGRVLLIWTRGDSQKVISVTDEDGDITNVTEQDKWVPHKSTVAPFLGLSFWADPGPTEVQDPE